MTIVDVEYKKDGFHWASRDDGSKGGPFKTQQEAFDDGYGKVLKAEAKAPKQDPAAAMGFVPQEEITPPEEAVVEEGEGAK